MLDPRTAKVITLARMRPADGALPHGITINKAGEERAPIVRPRNLLELAAMSDNRDMAISALMSAFGITSTHIAEAMLCDRERWKRIGAGGRLLEIADWLRAECFELLDFGEALPVSTRGD